MNHTRPHRNWVRDTKIAIAAANDSIPFINDHRLWKGFFKYKWVVKGSIVILIILGILAFQSVADFVRAGSMDTNSLSNLQSWSSIGELFSSGDSFLILILIEIIIFHFTRKTMMIVTEQHIDTSFKTFIEAEKRMIIIAFMAFGMGVAAKAVAKVAISISGFDFLLEPTHLLIDSFYLGFAVIDNYNELFGMTIKQSHRFTWHYAPVAVLTGAVLGLIMNITFVGAIIGPVICAVLATLAMHRITQLDRTIDWVYIEKPKKKKKKRMKA